MTNNQKASLKALNNTTKDIYLRQHLIKMIYLKINYRGQVNYMQIFVIYHLLKQENYYNQIKDHKMKYLGDKTRCLHSMDLV